MTPPLTRHRSVGVGVGARLLAALAAALVVLVAVAGPASAHRNDESYLYLDIGDDDLRGRVELPYQDIRDVLGLELEGDEDALRAEIEDNLELLQDYALATSTIGADGEAWVLTFVDEYELLEEEQFTESNGLGYVILPFIVELGGADVPQLIDVGFVPFLDEIPDRNNIALISNYWQQGVIGEEANELVVFSAGDRTGVIDLGNSSQWKNFDASIDLGVDHIRTGPDHIFFILVLLLPSVLILGSRGWEPATSFRSSLIRVLIVASMFTLAHSITFTLAGLDILPLPPAKFTESLIAVSIAVAALNNIKPFLGQREWLIAFVFGLFHGLGFAGFVEDLEISNTTKLVSLLGRNVGIEIGQAVIVLVVFPALWLLSRTVYYRFVFLAGSVGLAVVSIIWVFERVFELDAGINGMVDRVVKWPRSFWVMVVITAVIGAYVYLTGQSGQGSDGPDEPAEPDESDPVPAGV
ncbi:MAG: HupE/UreJ family protein [Actinomycetota bacterium]